METEFKEELLLNSKLLGDLQLSVWMHASSHFLDASHSVQVLVDIQNVFTMGIHTDSDLPWQRNKKSVKFNESKEFKMTWLTATVGVSIKLNEVQLYVNAQQCDAMITNAESGAKLAIHDTNGYISQARMPTSDQQWAATSDSFAVILNIGSRNTILVAYISLQLWSFIIRSTNLRWAVDMEVWQWFMWVT